MAGGAKINRLAGYKKLTRGYFPKLLFHKLRDAHMYNYLTKATSSIISVMLHKLLSCVCYNLS